MHYRKRNLHKDVPCSEERLNDHLLGWTSLNVNYCEYRT